MDIATDIDRHDPDTAETYVLGREDTDGHFGFADVLARTLPRLAMTAVPVRVLAVSSDAAGAATLVMRLRAVLSPECEIAALDERTAGVLCYAPGVSRNASPGGADGCGLMARIRPISDILPLDIRTLDLSSVEFADPGDVVMALRRAPVRRLAGKARVTRAA